MSAAAVRPAATAATIAESVGWPRRLPPRPRPRRACRRPSRYLAQLCKRFAHKLPVTYDAERGRVGVPAGACDLDAVVTAGILMMRVTAGDEADLARLEDVVARFAFREEPEARWTRAAPAAEGV